MTMTAVPDTDLALAPPADLIEVDDMPVDIEGIACQGRLYLRSGLSPDRLNVVREALARPASRPS